ncbi:MAG: hypothetical protein ABIJ96_01030 [Elusimicrobiota bacterium]
MTPVSTVAIVDDNKDMRETMAAELEDVNLRPALLEGPFQTVTALLKEIRGRRLEAAVCDYHLSPRGFAGFSGAQAVAELYQQKIPSVLVTAYGKVDVIDIRSFRDRLPILIHSDEVEPEMVVEGFKVCQLEFDNKFTEARKPWRTLVRVEEVDDRRSNPPIVKVTVPNWNAKTVVGFQLSMVPKSHRDKIKAGTRFYAEINLGATDQSDLYLKSFEFPGG